MSLSRDRISHGSNKFVMNLNINETEIPEDQLEEYALKLNAKDFACRPKAKAKTTKKITCWLFTKNSPLSDHEVSKKVIYLLRHSQQAH